jgi:hypothetical protein
MLRIGIKLVFAFDTGTLLFVATEYFSLFLFVVSQFHTLPRRLAISSFHQSMVSFKDFVV